MTVGTEPAAESRDRHSTGEPGSRAGFDAMEARKYFVEPHIPGFAQFARWRDKRVLEIGCGLGTDAANFAGTGAEYTGLGLSATRFDLAKRRFDVFGLDGTFMHSNAEGLDVRPASFDLVYSFGVIHHLPDPDAVLRQARRAIRPDGEFRLMLYAKDSWKDAMIAGNFDQPEAQPCCPIAHSYTQAEARAMLRAADFSAVEITQDHIFPYVMEKYARHEYQLQPWFAAMPPAMFRALEQRFGWHMLIVAQPG